MSNIIMMIKYFLSLFNPHSEWNKFSEKERRVNQDIEISSAILPDERIHAHLFGTYVGNMKFVSLCGMSRDVEMSIPPYAEWYDESYNYKWRPKKGTPSKHARI